MGSSLEKIEKREAFRYCDEELFSRIAEDGSPFLESSFPDADYLGIIKDGELVGFWIVTQVNGSTVDIHINMNERDRKNNADCGEKFLAFIFSLDWINKVVAEVPIIYPEVIKYCENHGLKKEGLLKEHILKQGEYCDCYILGLTRGDYGSC
jgi:RimJ/RimL family protein N-acetyltransferase